jgi:hypothetical protein
MKKWQPGLESFEHLSGTPGQPGARSKLVYQMGKRRIEMIETILTRNLPEDFTGSYEAKGVYNVIRVSFIPVDANTTRYVAENEFKFTNLTMKIFSWLMPGAFKKQSQQYLDLFKAFAEREGSGTDEEE